MESGASWMVVERGAHADVKIFNGDVYRRYPGAKYRGARTYYFRSSRKKSAPLHRDVWSFHNGPIPLGHDIHHRDGNPGNNHIDNLQCLTKEAHKDLHVNAMPEWRRTWLRTLRRPKRKTTEIVCGFCGRVFLSKRGALAKYCNAACLSADRRKRGLDNEIRVCARCSGEFSALKYKEQKYCSITCFNKRRSAV